MMHVSGLEYVLWIVGCLLDLVLCFSLYVKHSYRVLPIFSLWMTEVFIESSSLYLVDRFASTKHYTEAYWSFAFLEIALQIAVAFEFADKALRHRGKWVTGSRLPFLMCATVATLISVAVTLEAHPATTETLDLYYTRLELLLSMLMFLLSVTTLGIVYSCGSLWKPFYLYRFCGFLVWSAASATIDTMHVYWRMTPHFTALEAVHLGISDCVVFYWIVTSYYPRPSSKAQRDIGELSILEALYKRS